MSSRRAPWLIAVLSTALVCALPVLRAQQASLPFQDPALPLDARVPVRVGDATVLPGDAVVADAEAVDFFPASIADEVIARATRIVEQEDHERELVRKKLHRFRDVYPLKPELQRQFDESRRDKP
jgi:regulator of RNase E activity RraA